MVVRVRVSSIRENFSRKRNHVAVLFDQRHRRLPVTRWPATVSHEVELLPLKNYDEQPPPDTFGAPVCAVWTIRPVCPWEFALARPLVMYQRENKIAAGYAVYD